MHQSDALPHSAAALRTALLGRTTQAFFAQSLMGPAPTHGAVIEDILCHGHHLEIVFDDGIVMHTQLRRKGSWNLYRVGEKWHKRRSKADVVIETGEWVAVCFDAASTETYRSFDQHRHPRAGRSGPDISRLDADLQECANRIMHYDNLDATISEALLDQRVMRGVGNVFRCEVLWACGVHPWARITDLPKSSILDIVLTAASQVRANLESPARVTAPHVQGGLAVYARNGHKCSRCADIISISRISAEKRPVYWCPGCQIAGEPFRELDNSDPIARMMDPHPAAVLFMSDFFRNRQEPAGL